eukprot:GHVU01077365.1.p1 GENE.GHVU01077365.1~~GHVU01077365.1.p1  ORF type:complete len:101 (+),score=7.96 GHVU01077365.1:80-382(+)
MPTIRKHLVCFKFKPNTPSDFFLKMRATAEELVTKIEALSDLKVRESFAGERSGGYSHVLYSTFASRENLKVYDSHPEHQKFKSMLGPYLESAMAWDIEL